MKKSLLLILTLIFAITANAQIKYGVKAGVNLSQNTVSTLTFDDGCYYDGKAYDFLTGFHISGHVNFSLGKYFGIQPELSFSTQGGKYKSQFYLKEYHTGDDFYLPPIDNNTYTKNYHYINLPVLFEVKPFTNFSIFAGPQIGFNVYNDTDWNVNVCDFAIATGLQYAIAGKFLISARYNIGLTKTISDSRQWHSIAPMDHYSAKLTGGANRVLQFSVGYQF